MLQIVTDYCIILNVARERMDLTLTERRKLLMIRVTDLCDYILYRAYTETENCERAKGRFTNLWLQKALYFVFGEHLAMFSEPLLGSNFEAWMYGPVYPAAYVAYHDYHKDPIPQPDMCPSLENLSSDELTLINSTIKLCANLPASILIQKTHEQAPWIDASDNGKKVGIGVVISNESIARFFRYSKVDI